MCGMLHEQVSYKMDVLGKTLLHELTHFKALVSPSLKDKGRDYIYEPEEVRALDKDLAVHNADSYAWFAVETYWTTVCKRSFLDLAKRQPECRGKGEEKGKERCETSGERTL
jgi:predicted SprT family Zn-dependent metalloprotease